MIRAAAGCAMVLAGVSMGCVGLPKCTTIDTQYLMVERSLSQKSGLGQRAEITETQAYKTLHNGFKTVALRLPDNCYQAEVHRGENQDQQTTH